MRRIPMHMADWLEKLNGFLTLNDRAILDHARKVSHEMARALAETEYDTFSKQRIEESDRTGNDFDAAVAKLPSSQKRRKDDKA